MRPSIKDAAFSSQASRVADVFVKNLAVLSSREYSTKAGMTDEFMYIDCSNGVEMVLMRVKRALPETRYQKSLQVKLEDMSLRTCVDGTYNHIMYHALRRIK